jgi:hypothetical protein
MNNLSKGIVTALATVAILMGLMTVAISIPAAEAAPNPPAPAHANGCPPSENRPPFCP